MYISLDVLEKQFSIIFASSRVVVAAIKLSSDRQHKSKDNSMERLPAKQKHHVSTFATLLSYVLCRLLNVSSRSYRSAFNRKAGFPAPSCKSVVV